MCQIRAGIAFVVNSDLLIVLKAKEWECVKLCNVAVIARHPFLHYLKKQKQRLLHISDGIYILILRYL